MTHMHSDMEPRPRSRRFEVLLVTSQVIFAASSLLALVFTLTDRLQFISAVGLEVLLVVFTISAYVFGIYMFLRWRRTVRRAGFRIAVTGRPQVGKTVFSILLFDSLMNERLPSVKFTAESRSVISVFQAIRGLPREVWPKKTEEGNVAKYSGIIEQGQRVVDLEIGDSAGEYWLEFDDEKFRDPGYLEYVVTSNAFAHVIELETLVASNDMSGDVLTDVTDLELAARLKYSIKNDARVVPLLIVLSKADLVFSEVDLRSLDAGLFKPFVADQFGDIALLVRLPPETRNLLSDIENRLIRSFSSVYFVLSTANTVTDNRLATDHSGALLAWVVMQSSAAFHSGGSLLGRMLRPKER